MSIRRAIPVILLVFIAFSLFSTSSYAANPTDLNNIYCILSSTNVPIGNCIALAFPFSILAIMLSLIFAGAAYMGGEMMNYQPLKGFYKRELWETIKSFIILTVTFSALIISSAIAASFAGSTPQTGQGTVSQASSSITTNLASIYTTVDSKYLLPNLDDTEAAFGGLMGIAVGTELIRSLSFSSWFPIPIITEAGVIGDFAFGSIANVFQSSYLAPLYGASPSLALISGLPLASAATSLVIIEVVILQMQHDLLYVIAALGLGAFLPIGLMLRSTPFTRGLGGTLIAVGIGLAIVYPLILVGFNLPITNYIYSLTVAQQTQATCPSALPYLLCNFWNAAIFTINAVPGYVTGGLPLTIGFGIVLPSPHELNLAASGFWIGVFGPFINGIFPALNFVVADTFSQLVQFLLFGLDIIIWVALVQGLARVLGGELKLGVGKFKLA